ncbi:MAG: polyprenyl synthetase family protein [Deltaproteobacteria bacterium]|nr:MAG: polyprenyl synthetase family protein [Deltaproteobacteria bacterium]
MRAAAEKERSPLEVVDLHMGDFDATLPDELGPAPGVLQTVARTALRAGGKRIRPRLVYLAYLAAGGEGDIEAACRRYAVAVEYLHTATLLHDDLIDGASLRRGEVTAHRRFGPKEAVLSGDLLLARCLSLVAGGGNLSAMETLARAAERLAVGEAMEVELSRNAELGIDGWYAYAAAKTGALFAASAELGARAAGAGEAWCAALAAYGEAMGLAFQVADDVIDVVSTTERMGKEAGADLRAGIPSLPVIEALGILTGEERRVVEAVLTAAAPAEEIDRLFPEALRLVRTHGAPRAAKRTEGHVAEALSALTPLPPSEARTALEALTRRAVERLS